MMQNTSKHRPEVAQQRIVEETMSELQYAEYSPDIQDKVEQHRRFWAGEGPSLLFIPRVQNLHGPGR